MDVARRNLLAVCLNPAWQKTLCFQAVRRGAVNRAESRRECGGGKGVNAARACRLAGGEVAVALFAGGHTGDLLLAELTAAGIGNLTVRTDVATRTCTSVVDLADGSVTELIEPSGRVTQAQVEALRALLQATLPGMAAVALCGTLPPGVPESFYADLAGAARRGGAMVLLDGMTGAGLALAAGVDLLKLNLGEFLALTGAATAAAAARLCRERYGVAWIGVTDGPRPAYLFGPGLQQRWSLPPLPGQGSSIGAGDCATGVLLQRLAGRDLERETVTAAFAAALAAASASCLTDVPALYDPVQAERLRAGLAVAGIP